MGRSTVKCLLDTAWLLPHEFHSSYGYLHNIELVNILGWIREETYEATLSSKE